MLALWVFPALRWGLFVLLLDHLVAVVVVVVDDGHVGVVEHHLVVLPRNREIRRLFSRLTLLGPAVVRMRVNYI